jgi:hypothetical protein
LLKFRTRSASIRWAILAAAGYTFMGHSIGIVESPFVYPFFNVMFWVEFPAFILVRLAQYALFPHVTADQFFGGLSEGGWRLLVVAILSFFQWYLVGTAAQKLWQKLAQSFN